MKKAEYLFTPIGWSMCYLIFLVVGWLRGDHTYSILACLGITTTIRLEEIRRAIVNKGM